MLRSLHPVYDRSQPLPDRSRGGPLCKPGFHHCYPGQDITRAGGIATPSNQDLKARIAPFLYTCRFTFIDLHPSILYLGW